jgi:hypothetical protein
VCQQVVMLAGRRFSAASMVGGITRRSGVAAPAARESTRGIALSDADAARSPPRVRRWQSSRPQPTPRNRAQFSRSSSRSSRMPRQASRQWTCHRVTTWFVTRILMSGDMCRRLTPAGELRAGLPPTASCAEVPRAPRRFLCAASRGSRATTPRDPVVPATVQARSMQSPVLNFPIEMTAAALQCVCAASRVEYVRVGVDASVVSKVRHVVALSGCDRASLD